MKNKGYVVILDALIALIIALLMLTTLTKLHEPTASKSSATFFKSLHYMSEDVMDVLNKQGVLDEIGTKWAAANGSNSSGHWLNATNISRGYLDKLIPERFGYRLVIDDTDVLYDSDSDPDSDRPPDATASSKTHSTRLLVGYGSGLPTRGHVARAFLTNIREKTTSSYTYFGGFVGQGNLTKIITLPDGMDTVQSICLEYAAGDNFNLDIDGTPVPVVFPKSSGNMTANWQCVSNPDSYIPGGGNHTFNIIFLGDDIIYQYIGGGFIRVTYNTSEFNTSKETGESYYEFPGIEGLINLYSSFYVPGVLNSMDMHLKFYNNYSTYLTMGDVRVFDTRNNESREFCTINNNEYTCDIPDTNLSGILNDGGLDYVLDLSEQTIPLRMGVENITATNVIGFADVILITDLSRSMNWRIGYNDNTSGAIRLCDDPSLYKNDTRRVSLAKCLDKEFIDLILNISGNRVGLVGFNESAYASHSLTDDKNDLINEVNNYQDSPSGGTCACCAINKAINLLDNSQQLVSVVLTPPVESPHPYSKNLEPPTSGTWTINGSPTATKMRLHFTKIRTEANGDYLWVTDSNGNHVQMPGWEGNERPNEIDSDLDILDYWSGWGNGRFLTVNLDTNNPHQEYGFKVDKYEYIEEVDISKRERYIVVMMDGVTGFHCGGCNNTNGSSDCSGNVSDCWGPQCDDAIDDAICAACRAHNDHGIHVYSIGFGPVSVNCSNANRTLEGIAICGNTSYDGSTNATELKDIYHGIAEEIANVTYQSQAMGITGNITPNVLYPESYIKFSYSPVLNYSGYGEITLTQNTQRFNDIENCTGYIYITDMSKVTDMRMTSYSSRYWTDYLVVNNQTVYTLRDKHFGDDYMLIGDPYIVQIPPVLINPGLNNSILIETGDGPDPPYTGCSPDNRAVYTIRLSGRVGYGDVLPKKSGCKWTIQFEDNTNITETIPDYYNGTRECSYTSGNISYDMGDAVDDAIFRLLQRLDSNGNNKIDIRFDSNMIESDFSRAGGIRSLWGPITMKLIVWI
ncbi:MAG: VWA domain-containing protein [Candidatus Altiarchaeota archaeon]|nr:VWA domain-containing protein [Candidatus Altiarchaeota archaeon]